jgi:hypothetical protein
MVVGNRVRIKPVVGPEAIAPGEGEIVDVIAPRAIPDPQKVSLYFGVNDPHALSLPLLALPFSVTRFVIRRKEGSFLILLGEEQFNQVIDLLPDFQEAE